MNNNSYVYVNNFSGNSNNTFRSIISINIMTITDNENIVLTSVLSNRTFLCMKDTNNTFPTRLMIMKGI